MTPVTSTTFAAASTPVLPSIQARPLRSFNAIVFVMTLHHRSIGDTSCGRFLISRNEMTLRRSVGSLTCQSGVRHGNTVDICVLRAFVNGYDEDNRGSGCRLPSRMRSLIV